MVDQADKARELLVNPEIKKAEDLIKDGNLGKSRSFKDLKGPEIKITEIALEGPIFRKRLTVPLRTKDCTHPSCFDMNELMYSIYLKNGEKKCLFSNCRKPFNDFKTDLIIDRKYEEILGNVRKDCDKVVYYNDIDFYFCKDPIEIGDSAIRKLHERALLSLVVKKDHNLKEVLNLNPSSGPLITLNLTCPISLRRVNIPCRFKNCKHLEVFDLCSYMSQFQTNKSCPVCKYEPSSSVEELYKELRMDHTIFDFLRVQPYTVVKGLITRAQESIAPLVENSKYVRENLARLEQYEQRVNAFSKYSEMINNLMRNYREEKKLRTALDDDLKLIDTSQFDVKISLRDSVSKDMMTFPARLQDCKHIEAFDLTTFAIAFGQAFIDQKPIVKCPHPGCDVVMEDEFDDLADYIYVDGLLIRALALNVMDVVYIPSQDRFVDPSDKGYLRDLVMKKPKIDNLPSTKRLRRVNLKCELSEKTMKIPVVSNKCDHMACMDLDAYLEYRPQKCRNSDCGVELMLQDIHIDEVVEKVLKHNPKEDSVRYNVASDEIEEEPKPVEARMNAEPVPTFNIERKNKIQILSVGNNTNLMMVQPTSTTSTLQTQIFDTPIGKKVSSSKFESHIVTQGDPALKTTSQKLRILKIRDDEGNVIEDFDCQNRWVFWNSK